MRSSNSIWKLTVLAGVVGLGLLIVLQVQRNLDRSTTNNGDAKKRLEDFKPPSKLDDLDKTAADGDVPQGNTEPRRFTAQPRKLDPFAEEDIGNTALDDLPAKNSTAASRTGTTGRRLPSLDLDDTDANPFGEQSEPKPKNMAPHVDLTLNDSTDEQTTTAPEMPAHAAALDKPAKTRSKSRMAAKERAQELLQQARRLLDAGLTDDARQKATEAADIPVSYELIEDTPEAVLAEIDRLTTNTEAKTASLSREPIMLTGGQREPAVSEIVPAVPAFADTPTAASTKKSPSNDDDNVFADNRPQPSRAQKLNPDPPVPPAEDPPELAPFPDADMPTPKPLRSTLNANNSASAPVFDENDSSFRKPASNSDRAENAIQPGRLKPVTAAPLEMDAESETLSGEGTLRSDAPRGPQRPELKIEKIAPPNATLGQPMVYTIVIKNVGESSAREVVVEDQIPKGTNLSGTFPQAALSGKKLIWRFSEIKPGTQKEISVKVVPVTEGQVGSIARVNFQTEIAAKTTVGSPKLTMKLAAAPQARLGETVTLNFEVKNTGTVEAHRVVLRNLIPENLKLPDVSERDIEYEIGTLPAGKTQTIQLPLSTVRAGKAINKAVLSTDGATSAETQVEINVIGQLVSLSRQGQTSWYVGRPIEFENRLTNNSLNPTANTIVVESLPSSVEFISASNGGRFDTRQRTVTWHIPLLSPTDTLSLTLKVVPRSIGNHAGSVQITESGRKGAAIDYQFRAIGVAVLGVDFTEKAEAYSKGEKFSVRMQIKNKGSGAASNVSVRVTVPAELQFLSARGPVSHTLSGREIIFEPISEIGGQGNVALDLSFQAVEAGDSKLQVELRSDQFRKPLTHEEAVIVFASGTN